MAPPQNVLVEDLGNGVFRETPTNQPAVRYADGQGIPAPYVFSGRYDGDAGGADLSFMMRSAGLAVAQTQQDPNYFIAGAGKASKLRVYVHFNTMTHNVVFVLYKKVPGGFGIGTATPLTVTVTPGGAPKIVLDLVHEVDILATEAMHLDILVPASEVGHQIQVSAQMMFAPAG